jgi:hypothetical protein
MIAILYVMGFYKPVSVGHYSVLVNGLIFFTLMKICEEIAFPGIIYRITEENFSTV